MRAVCLLDTSIFLEILNIPGKAANHDAVVQELQRKIEGQESLFLPMATILETGNHIAQNGDGRQRRQCAERFVRQVTMAIDGLSPFTPIGFLETSEMRRWLADFPDWATRGQGLGDLSIVHDWQRLRDKNGGRRVYIWSLDQHLVGYDAN